MHRDNLGRFATKPAFTPAPQAAPAFNFHNVRDSNGKFISKLSAAPVYPKLGVDGIYRDKNGKFAPKPVFNAVKVDPIKPTRLSVATILAAIEKNGVKHTKGWGQFSDGKLIAGCAIAQGAYNLGLDEKQVHRALNRISLPKSVTSPVGYRALGNEIIRLNDSAGLSITQIVRQIRRDYAPALERTVLVNPKTKTHF